jgi:hypothetical protein
MTPYEAARPDDVEPLPEVWNDTAALWLSVVACALAVAAIATYVALAVRVGVGS